MNARPDIPAALADVALIDGPTCARAADMSQSLWNRLVREGDAPQPVIRQTRFTRWRLKDVREWLVARASQPGDSEAVVAHAKKASTAARVARNAAGA